MATTAKLHIRRNTHLIRGVDDRRRDQAVVRVFVRGLTNSKSIRDDAVSATLDAWRTSVGGLYHHDLNDLAMLSASCTSYALTSAWVELRFGRSNTDNPTKPPFAFADERFFGDRRVWLPYYTTNNGDGTFTSTDITSPGMFKTTYLSEPSGATDVWSVETRWKDTPITQITVPAGRLDDADLATIDALKGFYNDDAVTINGLCRPPYTLKFSGSRIRSVDQNGTTKRYCELAFRYCPDGWGWWRVAPFGSGNTTDGYGVVWVASFISIFPQASFAGAFPLHDGSTGPASGTCTHRDPTNPQWGAAAA